MALLMLCSCNSTKSIPASQLADKWVLHTINGKGASEVFTQTIPFILINPEIGQLSGNSGCNTFSGKYSYTKDLFAAPNLAVTQKACLKANAEPLFLELLAKTSHIFLSNDGELVFVQENMPVMVFSKGPVVAENDLAGSWELQNMNGESAAATFSANIPTLTFNFSEKRISGSGGCNRYNGPFTFAGNELDVKQLVTTRMACENMDGENTFINLLQGVSELQIENGVLLVKRNTLPVLSFVKK